MKVKSKGFTLIELLIVLALIAILATILTLIIKPTEILKKARDSQRIANLKQIEDIFNTLYTTDPTFSELNYFSAQTVYLSLPDSSSTCGSWSSQLPPLPSGWSYHCSATPTNIDGSGWLPLNFNNFSILNLAQLPLDPINQPPYYYSFVVGGSYELTATLEADINKGVNGTAGKDGGTSWNVYEVGSNLKLTPLSVEDGGKRDPSLVGYWSFDEGTGTIAYDKSGNGNNGTLYNGPQWTTGKVGGALRFDGVDDYVSVTHNAEFNFDDKTFTVACWVKTSDNSNVFIKKYGGGGTPAAWGIGLLPDIRFYDGTTGWKTSGVNVSDNQWHHIALVGDGSNINFYVDGVKKSSSAIGTIATNTEPLIIGRERATAFQYAGLIDEARIYNRALSAEEIKTFYEATK